MTDLSNVAAYCVKCKCRQIIANAQERDMKNNRKAIEGDCPGCGTKMYKIGAASK